MSLSLAGGAGGQQIEEALSCFEEMHTVETRTCTDPPRVGVYAFLLEVDHYSESEVQGIIEGLQAFAIAGGNSRLRVQATVWLSMTGERPGIEALDVVGRLSDVFEESLDPAVRQVILRMMPGQLDVSGAAVFLGEVAASPPQPADADRERSDAFTALFSLTNLGDAGRQELRRLHRQGAVGDGQGRGFLDALAKSDFRIR